MILGRREILEIERECARSHFVKNSVRRSYGAFVRRGRRRKQLLYDLGEKRHNGN
jgi:hypothetical protein